MANKPLPRPVPPHVQRASGAPVKDATYTFCFNALCNPFFFWEEMEPLGINRTNCYGLQGDTVCIKQGYEDLVAPLKAALAKRGLRLSVAIDVRVCRPWRHFQQLDLSST